MYYVLCFTSALVYVLCYLIVLLVIVNSCLERHLPHGLPFAIANSTSILHACFYVIALEDCSVFGNFVITLIYVEHDISCFKVNMFLYSVLRLFSMSMSML